MREKNEKIFFTFIFNAGDNDQIKAEIWFHLQELNDLKSSGLRSFKDIQVDEANLLLWTGLIVPVSR